MMAVLCQNAELDVPPSQQQKAMVDAEYEKERQRDEVVKKASTCSLLGTKESDSEEDATEYEEDLEPLQDDNDERPKDEVSKANHNEKVMEGMDSIPTPPRSPRRAVSSGRRRVSRSISLDGSLEVKRHSWGSARGGKKGKPDFRWDKAKGEKEFDWNKFKGGDSSPPPSPKKEGSSTPPPADIKRGTSGPVISASPRPQIRRRRPQRSKSFDLRAHGNNKSRPTLERTDSKVRFCMDFEVFEVPRPTKDMKPDLFYTKKEIKVFKAEKKEEKRELKQQKKLEKEKAKQRSSSAERATPASSTFATMESTPIATC